MKKRERISVVSKDESLSSNPFAEIDLSKVQLLKNELPNKVIKETEKLISESKKGRVDIRREKSGRGGKIVTVLEGIQSSEERRVVLKMLQKQIACGGTIK
jgi:translation initiation factor 1 (eIF-1/SUI1)